MVVKKDADALTRGVLSNHVRDWQPSEHTARAIMQVPSHWSTLKRPKPSRGGTSSSTATPLPTEGGATPARKKARQQHDHAEPVSLRELARSISQSILSTASARLDPTSLNLSTILSGVAYREILENLFGDGDGVSAEIPVVSKAYEEAYLRECIGPNERPCVMGADCEGHNISKTHRFACTELLLPGEGRAEPQMCVLCCRKHTQKLYYDVLYNPPAMHTGAIQRYGVVVGVPGEYAAGSALIMPATGPVHAMPFPSVAYCRADYTVVVRNATRFVVQAKVMDFPPPSHGIPFGSSA
jgi:hypothetical protein